MSTSRARFWVTAAVLLASLMLFLANHLVGAPAPLVETPRARPGEYQVYFTNPDLTARLAPPGSGTPAPGLPSTLAASFATAQHTLDVAVFEIDLPIYAEALIAAQQRGVRVRVVTDSDYLKEKPVQALLAAGIPVVDDQRGAFMHHKFAVIDGDQVWTGSLNYSYNDAYRNNNNLLWVRSAELAENFTAQFEALFTERRFAHAITPPHPSVAIPGVLIENYFSPDGGAAARLLELLQGARTDIRFLAFSFTRADFAEALIERARAGVQVAGVMEKRQIAAGASAVWQSLQAAGLAVRQDGNPYVLHSKVIIVDGQIVAMGSYNFSANAEDDNNENLLILHSPELAAAYLAEWQKVWAQAAK